MIRAALLLPAILFAPPIAAEALSDGSLARSVVIPFTVERDPGSASLLRVSRIDEGSTAFRSGLRAGDVIVRIDGKDYERPAAGRRLLEHGTGGRRVALEVRRRGATQRLRLVMPAAPLESIAGVISHYESLVTADGLRLRTITTRPEGADGRLPALYFVQWLSCDSIEYPLNPEDHGWQRMLQLLASRSGIVMMRTEKAGTGDSEGDCANLDYDTELDHHRQALRMLIADPRVDPARIVIFGASMGGNLATLLAAEFGPAGLVIWGTAIKSWFEHLVEFNRRHLELSGRPPVEIAAVVSRQISFLEELLIERRSPAEIAAADPALGAVWNEIRGSAGATLYGRPYRFHQQAQASNWLGAIASMEAPVLVLTGEFDWYEPPPRMDHHFSIYPGVDAAFRRERGFVAPERPVMEIVDWLRTVVGLGG